MVETLEKVRRRSIDTGRRVVSVCVFRIVWGEMKPVYWNIGIEWCANFAVRVGGLGNKDGNGFVEIVEWWCFGKIQR